MISVDDSYELFFDALSYLDEERLKDSDEDLEYIIFEELSADAVSFLHAWTLDRLIAADKIPVNIREDVLDLRTLILKELEFTKSVDQYRNSANWIEIRIKAKTLKSKILDKA